MVAIVSSSKTLIFLLSTWQACFQQLMIWFQMILQCMLQLIFLSQVNFIFLLFLGMVMNANEVETKEK